ncbi:hypothetical protein [Sphingomonas rubra]|uniref:hypothetical protein n=1 Tax=Sphingomonas rubra TaxID=634430 RepID=UPI0011607105|nr:hypothetical protein [Sphingomonas rubra]
MNSAKILIAAIVVLAMANRANAAPSCERVSGTVHSEIQSRLSMRAIDILMLAKSPKWASSRELARLVDRSVSVNSGVGHVGIPLPPGLSSLHFLAQSIDASDYRYEGWKYMDGPFDACARQIVSVEFFDKRSGRSWPLSFEFENGRVEAVKTWERAIISGPLPSVASLDQKGN